MKNGSCISYLAIGADQSALVIALDFDWFYPEGCYGSALGTFRPPPQVVQGLEILDIFP
jgi:hypothetical protein